MFLPMSNVLRKNVLHTQIGDRLFYLEEFCRLGCAAGSLHLWHKGYIILTDKLSLKYRFFSNCLTFSRKYLLLAVK